MPLTARRLDGTVLDATACSEEDWSRHYGRRQSHELLACPECASRMVAKVSSLGLRFFAHWGPRPPHCTLANESPAHRRLKALIARVVNASDLASATVEAPAPEGPRWRADVLATTPAGRRIAFEVQLSGQSVSETRQRTDRYAQDGVETVWVTTGHPPWFGRFPSIRVSAADAPQFDVTGGAARWHEDHKGAGRWLVPPGLTFDAWVTALLRDQVSAHEVTPGAWVFTTAAHLAAYRATQADREEQLRTAAEYAEKLAQITGRRKSGRSREPGPAMPELGRAELHPWAAGFRSRADARQSAAERQAQARILVRRALGLSEPGDDSAGREHP